MHKSRFIVSVILFSCVLSLFAEPLAVSFRAGGWSPDGWTMVKSPRWDHRGCWQQMEDCIANEVPADATKDEMLYARASETYTSMLRTQPVKGKFAIFSTMSFQYRMAPVIVLAKEPVADATGYPEYREHWEVVLFDKGLNIWHHEYEDGKPKWHLAASAEYQFLPETKYTLTLLVDRFPYGARLTVICGDAKLIFTEHDLPDTLFVGITGCEGVCKFYDFAIDQR